LTKTFELPLIGEVSEADIAAAAERRRAAGKKGVFIHTLGCQMNEHDSEIILGLLTGLGYRRVDNLLDADLIIYNTCCVRENPERKIYGQLAMLRRLHQLRPDLLIGVGGCMAQKKDEYMRMAKEFPHVKIIFGTHNLHRLPELIQEAEITGKQVVEVWDEPGGVVEDLPVVRSSAIKAYVTIMYGCDEHCTYCIVPAVRGRERSRQPERILQEVQELAADGCQEVMLLGQNVNAYGRDLAEKTTFARLLQLLDENTGIKRLRFTSPHPRYFGDDVISIMAAGRAICEHVHLPAQAGSDRVLRRMGRRYSRADYINLVTKMKQAIPDLAVTTDLIVGFPGETEEDFAETLSLVREVQFDGAFMFIYSPRDGTAATRLPETVPEEVKRERIHRLVEQQNTVSLAKNKELIGKRVTVLVDGAGKEPQTLAGRTRTNKLVVFPAEGRKIGQFVEVEITEAHTWSLSGRPLAVGAGEGAGSTADPRKF